MELIESGLAGMEISMGESDTKPRVNMKSVREAQSASLRRIREFQERIRSRRERALRDPQPPPQHESEEEQEKATAPTEENWMELGESELAAVQSYASYVEIMERKEQQFREAYDTIRENGFYTTETSINCSFAIEQSSSAHIPVTNEFSCSYATGC
ncbi:hypothetical protein ZWY2020_013772 [Hordeum vulgare]|nr:hypothetical protein ZWY2020_013772 [Hordeum vulgare]